MRWPWNKFLAWKRCINNVHINWLNSITRGNDICYKKKGPKLCTNNGQISRFMIYLSNLATYWKYSMVWFNTFIKPTIKNVKRNRILQEIQSVHKQKCYIETDSQVNKIKFLLQILQNV